MLPTLQRSLQLFAAALLALATLTGSANAQLRTGHSIPGFHGLESSVLPPIGLSYENTSLIYTSDTMTDANGNSQKTGSIRALSNHSKITYVTPWLLLGGNFVMSATVPLVNTAPNPHTTDLASAGIKLGDIRLEPVSISWEGNKHILTMGYAYWWDTGSFDANRRDNAGKGFVTHEASLGVTYYPTEKRDWNISVLGRYELHESMSGIDLKPGEDFILDWSVGKHIGERWNVGAVGYGVWQTTREEGADGNTTIGYYGSAAFGGEARYRMPNWNGDIAARGYYELNSFNRPEGQALFLELNFGF